MSKLTYEEMEAKLQEYDHMLSWHTTCKGCADSLDKSYAAYCSEEVTRERELRQKLEAELELLRVK